MSDSKPAEAEAAPSTSTATTTMTSEIPKEFAEPFAKAKSLYHKDHVDQAGAILSDLLEKMVVQFGQLGGPCGRVYHLYGLCLLASARKEAPLLAAEQLEQLTSAIDDPATSAGSSASTAASSSASTAKQQDGSQSQPASSSKDASKDTSVDNGGDAGDDDDDDEGDDDDNVSGDQQPQGEQGEEDDASLVQVGWECLECARVIFSGLPDSEDSRTRQADVHYELGSLYFETEQYPAAAEELEQCVELRRKWLPDSRELAQALCQYGAVQKQLKDMVKARELFEEARGVVSKLIEQVETQTDARSKRALRTLQVIRDEVTSHTQQLENQGKGAPKEAVSKVESMTNSFDAPTVTSPTTHVAQVKSRKKPKKKTQPKQSNGAGGSTSTQPTKKAKTTAD